MAAGDPESTGRTIVRRLLPQTVVVVVSMRILRHVRQLGRLFAKRRATDEALNEARRELEAERRGTELLQSISTESFTLEDADFYQAIVDAAVSIMGSDFGSMQILRPNGALKLLAHRGFSKQAELHWHTVSPTSHCGCGEALRTGHRVVISDIEHAEYIRGTKDEAVYQSLGIRSVQSTPLRSRSGSVIGMVSTHWKQVGEPPVGALRRLDILGRQAADWLERRQSHDMISALNGRLGADLAAVTRLYEMSARLVQSTDLSTLLLEVLATAVSITGATRGHVHLLEGGTLRLVAEHRFKKPYLDFFGEVTAESVVFQQVLGSSQRIIIEDVTEDATFAGTPELELLLAAGVRGVQFSPIPARSGEILGVLATHYRIPHRPSERCLRTIELLTREAADLIERHQAERQRERLLENERAARAEAERAASVKEEFLATLSHELRTPLNAVMGWLQILRRDLAKPERARVALEVIERNARQQAKLIADLLDISRILSGKMRLELQQLDVAAVVDAAIESVLPAAEAKEVLIVRVADATDARLMGDPARLQQMVWNVVANAVKFTPRGGEVRVGVASVPGGVEIRVTDTGEGISSDLLPHIFDRFRQGDASTTRSHGGLGLGLAIVKQFAELHGGSVEVSSEGKGKGSTFVMRLPLSVATQAPPAEFVPLPPNVATEIAPRSSPPLKGIRVLVVDDEPDALEMVRRVLEESEANVDTAPSSDAALELLAKQTFDVIVSDIGMPVRDGYELISEVRTRGVDVPAIALTAFAHSSDRAKAMAAGFQAHLAKPVDAADLLGAIARLHAPKERASL